MQQGRRDFLIGLLKSTGKITLASTAVYSISLISSKEKFGGLTAGAKSWQFGKGVLVPASGCETHDSRLFPTRAACEATYNPMGTCRTWFEPCWKNR